MSKLVHTMIRVRDLDVAIHFYRAAFEMRESHRLDFPEFTLVYLRGPQGEAEIELTLNKGQEEPYSHGTGYGHVAFAVDDLEAAHRRMTDEGFAPGDIKALRRGDETLARFFFITDPDGYRIEVLAAEGHYA